MKDGTHLWRSDTASYNCPIKARVWLKRKGMFGAVDKGLLGKITKLGL